MNYLGKIVLLITVVLVAPGLLYAQVELPAGATVEQNVKGDFFESQKGGDIFDASPGQLKSNTEPPPRATPQVQPTPSPTPEAELQELNKPQSGGNMENLKDQVIDRAQQDRGMMELLNRTRQIKEQLGVGDPTNGESAPTREQLKSVIEGVKRSVDDDPKKKSSLIAFNGPELGGSDANKEYAPKSVLSLIVSGTDPSHLSRYTKKLNRLTKHRNVKIGNVFIVGMSGVGGTLAGDSRKKKRKTRTVRRLVPSKDWLKGNYKELSKAGLENYEVVLTSKLFERYDITYSPTWVVRHLGRDYVFEGYSDPVHFFTKKGEFVRADY